MTLSDSSADDRCQSVATEPTAPGAFRGGQQRREAAGKVKRVSRTTVNFAVDFVLMLLVILLLFTAAVVRYVFPTPSAAAGWLLWGYGIDDWSAFQFVLVTIIGLSVLLHVMLHWSWVCGVVLTKILGRSGRTVRPDDGQQTLWGVGMLIAVVNILGLLIGLAYLAIQSPSP